MTTLFKKVALASALALSFAGAAQAKSYDAGLVTADGYYQVATPGAVGSFVDQYSFTIAPNLDANVSALAFKLKSSGVTLSSFTLYADALGTAFNSATSTVLGQRTIDRTTVGEYSPSLYFAEGLSSNMSYTLVVAGSAYTTKSSYTTQVQISPVPEPETYAMLLAGLGVMGFVARRRQKADKA